VVAVPKSKNFVQRFFAGQRSCFRGIKTTIKNRNVRLAYVWISAVLALCTLLIQGACIASVFHFIPLTDEAHLSVVIGMWLLRGAAILVACLLAPILAIGLCKTAIPLFSEIPFMAGMRVVDEPFAQELQTQRGIPLLPGIWLALSRMALFLGLTGICFLIGLIPVAGAFIATPLQLFFTARAIGWEMLDPYFDKRDLRLKRQRQFVRDHFPEVLGMGSVCAPLLALPFVGSLLFVVLQAAVAQFVVDHVESGQHLETSRLLPADLNKSRLESPG
jgi:Etoposide-induced protein 2.4 (EI24)